MLPKYIDPPMDFITEKVIPSDDTLTEAQKEKIIRERLKEHFRFMSKPPSWIQRPDWPIRNGKPLFFLGQIAVSAPALFHDNGTVYLFYDSVDGTFVTVAQFH